MKFCGKTIHLTEDDDTAGEKVEKEPEVDPYEMEDWRVTRKIETAATALGAMGGDTDGFLDFLDQFPSQWFVKEPQLYRYADQQPPEIAQRLRDVFLDADQKTMEFAEKISQSRELPGPIHPAIEDWKAFFEQADKWKTTLSKLSPEQAIMLWNYYLIETKYWSMIKHRLHTGYVLMGFHDYAVDEFLKHWDISRLLKAIWAANENSLRLRSAPSALWEGRDDVTGDPTLHGGSLLDAVQAAIDTDILSAYLVMRGMDLDVILKVARDATEKFEEERF